MISSATARFFTQRSMAVLMMKRWASASVMPRILMSISLARFISLISSTSSLTSS